MGVAALHKKSHLHKKSDLCTKSRTKRRRVLNGSVPMLGVGPPPAKSVPRNRKVVDYGRVTFQYGENSIILRNNCNHDVPKKSP